MSAAEPQPALSTRSIRRFHPTPDRCLAALLGAEGLLWLSDRCGWLAWHMGYAVLTAVAAIGAALVLTLLCFIVALLFRWRFQFSLRTLLVLTAAVALPFSWLAVEMRKAKEERGAVNQIARCGEQTAFDWEDDANGMPLPNAQPPATSWLRNLLGSEFFADIVSVDLGLTKATDTDLEHLKTLSQLRRLDLSYTNVTDLGLKSLNGLVQLRWLDLEYTHVTDDGVDELQKALPNCEIDY